MSNNALYVYGIVKSDLDWGEIGLDGAKVYPIKEGEFSALVHDCEEKPYTSEYPEKIKELVIAHNKVLENAIKHLGGVIPLPFNNIVKRGESSAEDSLKKWLNGEKERLEGIWSKVIGKKEYGLRVYYERQKLLQKMHNCKEIKEMERSYGGKSAGLNYLFQGRIKDKINDLAYKEAYRLKEKFYDTIGEVADDTKVNESSIMIEEEKDLLLSLSILTDEQKIREIEDLLKKKTRKDFSFHLAGPFPPYSFVENESI